LIGPALAIATITGLLAGLYPAVYISKFKPIEGIKKTTNTETTVRKALVVFQFALSTLFIVCVGIIYRQVQLIEHKNLGYDREHVVYFEFGRAVPEATLQRIKSLKGVVNAAAFHHNITDRDGGTSDMNWPGKDPNHQINFTDLDVGYDFIETMKIPIQEGRSYSKDYGNDATGIVFNESAVKIMGLQHPIGQVVHLWGQDRTIIGVVKDFHFQSLHENIKPCFFDLSTNAWASKVAVRISGNDVIQRLATLVNTENPGYPLEYRFLDYDYQALYASELQVAKLSKYFAGLAVLISCLGLFGLAAFTAQRRQKEIGIRKVVGASTGRIVSMLIRDFLMPVGLAALLALPIAGWLMNRWLESFAYRVTAGPWMYVMATAVLLTITLGTVTVTSIRAAKMNPVKSLKQS
jgi:hypothetical protein